MAVPLRPRVYCIVLGACQELAVVCVVGSLKSSHYCHSHACRQVRVLTVCLLSTSPSWVAEDVYVRSPERQALVLADNSRALCLLVLYACLVADSLEALL